MAVSPVPVWGRLLKIGCPALDLAVSHPNKTLTIPVENVPYFKDLIDKQLEALPHTFLSQVYPTFPPALAITLICQILAALLIAIQADPLLREHLYTSVLTRNLGLGLGGFIPPQRPRSIPLIIPRL